MDAWTARWGKKSWLDGSGQSDCEWVFLYLTATDKWNTTEVIQFAGTSRLVMINIFKGGATIKRDLNRLEE